MDEPLCFVHFIITLTCFQNKKGCFCFSKYFEQTALELLLTGYATLISL